MPIAPIADDDDYLEDDHEDPAEQGHRGERDRPTDEGGTWLPVWPTDRDDDDAARQSER